MENYLLVDEKKVFKLQANVTGGVTAAFQENKRSVEAIKIL